MITITKAVFIILCVFALFGFAGVIGLSIRMIRENKHTKPALTRFEKVDAFGVSVDAKQLFSYEDIVKGNLTENCKKCDELARKHGCVGVQARKNDAIYLFLVESSQIAYYNEIKQLVKAKLLKEPIKAERVAK